MLMNVVLPAPFGPIRQRISPASREKSMLSLATSPRKRLLSPSVRRISTMLTRAATDGTLDRARNAAFESDYDYDENDADHQLPVLRRDRGQIIRERRHHHRAEQRAQQRLPPPDRHPDDDLRRE